MGEFDVSNIHVWLNGWTNKLNQTSEKIWYGDPKYSEKTWPSAILSSKKSYLHWPGIERGPEQWEARDKSLLEPILACIAHKGVRKIDVGFISKRVSENK